MRASAAFTIRSGLTIDNDDFKNAYVGGKLLVDCVEITFTQNDSKNPRVYAARGCIQASPEHGVYARLICPRDPADPYEPMAALIRGGDFTPGALLPDNHYYRLSARDVVGNVWTHPSVDLKVDDGPEVVVLSFFCDRIQTESTVEGARPYAYFVFLDDLEFPENTIRTTRVESGGEFESGSTRVEGSKGAVAGMRISYDKRKNAPGERYSEFVVTVPKGVSVAASFQDRMLEAIRFCTATMATPVMSETVIEGVRTIELAKSRPLNNSGIVHAPVSTVRPDSARDFYMLFECYFIYACSNAKGKEFAPISSKIGGLFTLKGVWIDTIALLLGVAVEGILKEDKFKDIVKQETTLWGEIEKLIEHISGAPIGASLISRVVGAAQGMSSTSASDKLHALFQSGALEEEDRKAWKRIRNKSAHGSFEVNPKQMQSVLDDVFRLTTLVYKLVFLLIGYSGSYFNRAPGRWRDDQFDASAYWLALKTGSSDSKRVTQIGEMS